MKNIFLILLISISLISCINKSNLETILIPRPLKPGESFNDAPKSTNKIFNIKKVGAEVNDKNEIFEISFADTLVAIQKESKGVISNFINPKYLNSQKTALLAEVDYVNHSVFYILTANKGRIEAVELSRPSNVKSKEKGIEEISRSILLLNNDFLVTTINGKIYPIKRQIESEPINGKIFMVSRDASTLIFLTKNSFYQYNYLTGESFNLVIDPQLLVNKAALYSTVQRDFSWFKNARGTLFLKKVDENRIIDIKDFKH